MASSSSTSAPDSDTPSAPNAPLPKGIVLGPDGKPCRSCNSKSAFSAWSSLAKKQINDSPNNTHSTSKSTSTSTPFASSTHTAPLPISNDCPPDVEELGRSTWTLLHSIAAQYPTTPSPTQQDHARTFISSFSQLYPCWSCASEFRAWLSKDGNAPRVSSRSDFGRWLCEAHNEVNTKLGKKTFDCERWEERWRVGWKDGRCD
ncbi:hypothetical protein BT63DRAFT_429277 [Microthyrium microscopicum]|uniref:Sulfhydryl oxidase n=1 Tax=Microthyrium microscopicum TaxID=703497 RepID=A0A6A6TZT6_9PEZI|nr:hypothetical protein BT63DRAFT_429277 [Microthyrium microscopicum]